MHIRGGELMYHLMLFRLLMSHLYKSLIIKG